MKIHMLFLGLLFSPAAAFGQILHPNVAKDTSRTLNEVEITATTNPSKKLLYQPLSIVKLNEVELKRGTGLFLDDAININVPGVFMERRTVSGGQQINIRGYGNGVGFKGVNNNFDAAGTKVYLNGIPITDAEGVTVMDDIDFGSIGNIEIIKGPAGAMYGLAIAGVVNLQTIKPEKGRISIGQDFLAGNYGLRRYTTHLQLGGASSSILINYGKQLYGGFMPHTASHKDFINVVGEFQPNAKQFVTTYFGYSNSYDERNGELTIGQYDTLNYSGNERYIKNNAHSELISIRGGFGHTFKFNKHFSNATSVFASAINSNASSAGGWTDKLPVNYGLRSTIDMKFSRNADFNLSGALGVESQVQNAQTISYAMVLNGANPSGYYIIGDLKSNQSTTSKTTSLFTQWTLTMPRDFSVTVGLGMSNMHNELNDRSSVSANNRPVTKTPASYEISYNGLYSPRIAVNKVFSKQLSIYASYSVGYKAPVSSHFFIPTTGALNLGLKPEKGTQYEIGTKGTLLKNKLNYQIAAFDAIFSNKMTAIAVPDPERTTTLYTYIVNGGSQDNKGIEVSMKYNAYQSKTAFFKSLRPFANFAYSDFKYVDFRYQSKGKDVNKKDSLITADYSGKAVAGVSPITVNAGIDILTRLGIYANITYSYRDAMPFTSDGKNITKSFSQLNAKVGLRHSITKHWDIDFFLGANNITGSQYYYMVFLNQLPDAYIPAPNEINYFGGLNLKYSF